MEYKKLGNSGVYVSPIAFGAWAIGGWMWGGADKNDAINAIYTALNHGITTIDTAPVYGFGVSEEIVGQAIKGRRDKVQILTKYGLRWDAKVGQFYFPTRDNQGNSISLYKYSGKESIVRECEQSLKRLKTDYIDLYQIHWPDPTTPIQETMLVMDQLLKEGKIRAAGVCNYSVEEMRTAEDTVTLASNQVPYSMVKRDIEKDLVPYCLENNKAILPYSPLQRGLLTGKIKPGHKFNRGDSRPMTPHFQKQNIRRINEFLKQIKPIADFKNATLSQLVLRWTMQMPGITCILAGARNPAQVKDNVGAMKFSLSKEEMKRINDLIEDLRLEL